MDIVELCNKTLAKLDADKPWMSAKGLSKRIKSTEEVEIQAEAIESALIEHSRSPNRAIRYSYYPSQKTLDILWGHVDVVGEKQTLPSLYRNDNPDGNEELDFSGDKKKFFVSFNHKDMDQVIGLKRSLLSRGYDSWVFDLEIPIGGMIIQHVQDAIYKCDNFISYVTRESIGSLWVRKEFQAACADINSPIVIIDGGDDQLMQLFNDYNSDKVKACKAFAAELEKEPESKWFSRLDYFMHSLHERIGGENKLIAFPFPQKPLQWKNLAATLSTLDDFFG